MENATASASKASVRRSKRARVSRFGGAGTSAGLKEPGDQSPNQPDHDDSMDDFDEIRPKVKRSRAAEHSNAQIGDKRLIEAIRGDKKPILNAVRHWFERFEKDPKPAIVDLLTMSFEACGVKYQIDGDFEKLDVKEVVNHLVKLAIDGKVAYQSSKSKKFNHFKGNLVHFWDRLVMEGQNWPLFDGGVFEKCVDYVIALSCTRPRIYRHVASAIGLQLLTSFSTIVPILVSQGETAVRQMNAERRKHANSSHQGSLSIRVSEIQKKINSVEKMMEKIFEELFAHSYRDIDSDIRMSCMKSLGSCILAYEPWFLRKNSLECLGHAISDETAGVRKASVITLQHISDAHELTLFTRRYANHMIELADDVDISVAVSSIGLVKQVLRHGLLTDYNLGPLCDLLIYKPPEIRRAIGALVYDHVIEKSASNAGSKGTDEDSAVSLIRMLQLLRKFSSKPILISHVIDVVWEFMKSMTDWKCIISMLVDYERWDKELDENDTRNLIRLLFASGRKAVGERIVSAVDNRKPHFTDVQKEEFKKSRLNMTSAMMERYPVLLGKYMNDKETVPSLVGIIQNMDLELYSSMQREKVFYSVFEYLEHTFFMHGDNESLRSCVQAIDFCITDSKTELQVSLVQKLKKLEDKLLLNLKFAIELLDDDYDLLVNLKRLYELQHQKSVPIDSLFPCFSNMLDNFGSKNDEVVSFLLLNMYLHLCWSLCFVEDSAPSAESLSSLCSKRDSLLRDLGVFLNSSHGEGGATVGNNLASRVCLMLSDIWRLFRKPYFSSTAFESLGFAPDQSAIRQFWQLCEKQLNISNENDEEDVSKDYARKINPDLILIAAGKLITSETVPMAMDYLGPQVIYRFTMHGNSAAKIVMELISVLRNYVDIPDLLIAALKIAYHRHQIEVSLKDEESAMRTLQDCDDLSMRLCGTVMGYQRSEDTSEVLKIVKNCIEYAFTDTPKHLSFLDCGVRRFVSKLPKADVIDILKDVEGRTEKLNTDEDPGGWSPYYKFVNALKKMCRMKVLQVTHFIIRSIREDMEEIKLKITSLSSNLSF